MNLADLPAWEVDEVVKRWMAGGKAYYRYEARMPNRQWVNIVTYDACKTYTIEVHHWKPEWSVPPAQYWRPVEPLVAQCILHELWSRRTWYQRLWRWLLRR